MLCKIQIRCTLINSTYEYVIVFIVHKFYMKHNFSSHNKKPILHRKKEQHKKCHTMDWNMFTSLGELLMRFFQPLRFSTYTIFQCFFCNTQSHWRQNLGLINFIMEAYGLDTSWFFIEFANFSLLPLWPSPFVKYVVPENIHDNVYNLDIVFCKWQKCQYQL